MALHGFRRTAGRVVIRLDAVERGLLRDLLGQLRELVQPGRGPADEESDPLARMVGIDPAASTPTDPALLRLFPDGYGDDEPEAAAEFRRFTERSLREGKVANAERMMGALDGPGNKVVLEREDALAWLGALNDLRLTIGTRLGVTEDLEDRPPGGTDEAALVVYGVYDWLTFLQETLVQAVMGLPPDQEPPAGAR